MPEYEKKPNEGALFKNKKRETDKHPHARGYQIMVCPHCSRPSEHWTSAWTNEKPDGEKWQKLKTDPKEEQAEQAPAAQPAEESDDSVPF